MLLTFIQILSNAEDRQFQEVLRNLIEDEHANVIVCFCEGMTIRGLLQAMKEMNLTHRFLIIGSDGWADRQEVVCVISFVISLLLFSIY